MSNDSQALLQQFRQSIYARITEPEKQSAISPGEAVNDRAAKFASWRSAAQNDNLPSELPSDVTRHWVVADLVSLSKASPQIKDDITRLISKNAGSEEAYAAALNSIDGKLAKEIRLTTAKEQLLQTVVDIRKSSSQDILRRERASLLDETPEAANRLKGLLPPQWSGEVQIEPFKDPVMGELLNISVQLDDGKSQHVAFVDTNAQAVELVKRIKASHGTTEPTVNHALENGFGPGTVAKPSDNATDMTTEKTINRPTLKTDDVPFVSKVLDSSSYETLKDGSVLYSVNGKHAFIDHGQRILMNPKASMNEEAIVAAVLLAKEKFGGSFELTGSDEFKRKSIEVMLKHNIDVQLKDPQQDALRRELAKQIVPDAQSRSKNVPASACQPAPTPMTEKVPSLPAEKAADGMVGSPVKPVAESSTGEPPAKKSATKSKVKPANQADAAAPAAPMPRSNPTNPAIPAPAPALVPDALDAGQLVLRGMRSGASGQFETTALLFKGEGDRLRGLITLKGRQQEVLAEICQRKPDPDTGVLGSNYLKLMVAKEDGTTRQIGYANPVNQRQDGKPVYFDEVLMTIDGDKLSLRVDPKVGSEMHCKLGFQEPRVPRPANITSTPKREADTPKVEAVAARDKAETITIAPHRRSSLRPRA